MRRANPPTTTRPANHRVVRKDVTRPRHDPPTLFDLDLPERPEGTYLTSVYQLERVPATTEGLHDAVDQRYLRKHDFTVEERLVAGAPALLVHGTVPRQRADWCDVLASLTGEMIDLGFSSGGAALLVAVDDHVYALAYGTVGRHMVDLDLANTGFGIGFAVRSLAPDEIKQVRRRVFGTTGRVDRNMVPGGQHIRMYGIDKWGEIVGQVCGRTFNPNLTVCRSTRKATPVEGSDALRIHLGVEPENLLADLREINRVCKQEAPFEDLEFITQIRPIPSRDPRLSEVEGRLDALLASPDPDEVGLAVPGRVLGEIERIRSYKLRVPKSGLSTARLSELTLADILTQTGGVPEGERWASLCNGRITLCADTRGEEEIGSTAASRWITAQLPHGTSQLLLHEGGWYEIGDRHREFLRAEIEQILAVPASIALPAWTADLTDEAEYNIHAAAVCGLTLLDRRLLRTSQHHRGIEACDLLGPNDELIHVKRAKGSSALSHLFAQGEVSVDALRYEADARKALVEMVRQQPTARLIDADFRPRKVIYAIALGSGKPLTVHSLFTFAQVALYRAMKSLRNEGVEVEVVGIPSA
ncbi:sporadically distributed protein, TIGR04141 family [Micromonospora echinaurantiaca]|uniref:Sporadically distributed protein, TIGR04141 family n=1 Tax=Micromonospora echinaurantiaca TaxID=47857 RepID=A0A1C5I6B9_9ACTN|nr:DUF6119 family protein [Micromonospora echinaurantiaca]SCG53834.1 sporadically distributed protein, TIGR04141 family [Micromonospora echinaurantiaca]